MARKSHRHLAIVHGVGPLRDTQTTDSAVIVSETSELAAKHEHRPDRSSARVKSDAGGALPHAESESEKARVLQVGDLAKETGKTVRAIHLYEDMGLLTPVQRSRGRYRLYNESSVERVRWIIKLQALGFSLPDVQKLLQGQADAATGVEAALLLRGAYVEKLAGVQTKLAELHRLEQELLSSLTYLDACQSACDRDIHLDSCPECSRHLDQPDAPALVTGAHIS